MNALIVMTALAVGQYDCPCEVTCVGYDVTALRTYAPAPQRHGVLRGQCRRPLRNLGAAVLEAKLLRRAYWRMRERPRLRQLRACVFRGRCR